MAASKDSYRVTDLLIENATVWRGSGSVGNDDGENPAGLRVTEVLQLGQERVARAKAEREAAQRDIDWEGDV